MKNIRLHITCLLIVLLFPFIQIQSIATDEASYDAEFDFIQKVIVANGDSIYPTEFWSLRGEYLENRKKYKVESTASLSENKSQEPEEQTDRIGLFGLAAAIQAISKAQNEYLELFPQDNRDVYKSRLDQLIEISETALLMKEDLWHEDYVNELLKHVVGLRAAGISEKLPKFLWNPRINIGITSNNFRTAAVIASSAYDENFRRFGVLRSYLPEGDDKEKWLQPSPYQSVVWDLSKYMINAGANESFIGRFAEESKFFINHPLPRAVKGFMIRQRNVPVSSYYGGSNFSNLPSYKDSKAVIIWHAFTQEILKNTQFRHQNREKKTVRVIRTLRVTLPNEEGKRTMPQGVFDSVGVFFPFSYFDTITVFEVPNHRILGVFFMEKAAGSATAGSVEESGLFLKDLENEFLAMLEGIPFEVVSWKNLDLNGDTAFDSYALNSYYQNKLSLIDDTYAKDNLNIMLANASFLGDFDAVHLFIELGADVNFLNVKDSTGKTPLHYAVEKGDKGIVSLLLDKSADVNAKDKYDKMPLHYAVAEGDMAIVSLLLDKGADVNVKDSSGKTLLHHAVEKGDKGIVSLLLDKSADVNAKDKYDKMPLHYAVEKGDMAIVSLLEEKMQSQPKY